MAANNAQRKQQAESGVETPPSKSELLQRHGQELTAALGEIVAVLMRDPRFRHMSLGDLEWAIVPALLTNQFMLMRGTVQAQHEEAAPSGRTISVPVGVALWASVSDEVSEKLARQVADRVPYRLMPSEWKSGTNLWLVALVGPPRAISASRKRLHVEFNDRPIRDHVAPVGQPAVGVQNDTV